MTVGEAPVLTKEFGMDVFSGNGLFDPRSLDGFDFDVEEREVSVIIPTYGRTPYHADSEDASRNPICWAVDSLASQRGNVVREIIVIDDASTDYTPKLMKDLEKRVSAAGIDFIGLRNRTNLGSSKSRNKGINAATGRYVFFADDDCIFSGYSLIGTQYTFEKLSNEQSVVAIHLPVYYRSTKPTKDVRAEDIVKLDFENAIIKGDFGNFPSEYLNGHPQKFLDTISSIFNPVEIENLGGVFLADRHHVIKAGGFPEYLTWPNAYCEETILACNLIKSGKKLFFTPDPKLASIHFRFGFPDLTWANNLNEEELSNKMYDSELTLGEMLEESSVERPNTGNRVTAEAFAYSKITSRFYVFLAYSEQPDAAIKWARETKKEFVHQNNIDSRYILKVPRLAKRHKIWHRAIRNGIDLVKRLHDRDYSHIIEKI